MKIINTGEKGWQKKLSTAMKNKETVIIQTTDKKFAEKLEANKIDTGFLKTVLFGSVSAGAGTATIMGVSGLAKVGALSFLAAAADPEPISKSILVGIGVALGIFGLGWLVYLIRKLVKNKYRFKFKAKIKTKAGVFCWEFEAEPA